MKYLISTNFGQSLRWNGKDLLSLGHPVKYILQKKNDQLLLRSFTSEENVSTSLKSYSLKNAGSDQNLTLSPSAFDRIEIKLLNSIKPANFIEAARLQVAPLSTIGMALPEDIAFQKKIKQFSTAGVLMLLALFVTKAMEPDLKTNEDLIPKKYAKLIMTPPKEHLKEPAAGGSAQSQAQAKGIARAFQSKTVQKNIRNILKGGLSKYSIMATGRAIESLSQKIAGATPITGVGLQKKASDLYAGTQTGNYQMGSDSGYGTGQGTNIKGQGKGQFEVGLNTQDATVEEGLTKDEVAKVIHSHINEIRYCYEAAILKDPTLAGKVMIDFKINATGMVPNAGVGEESLTDRQVGSCLIGKLKNWKFPQPRGGVMVAVSYPFVFKSLSR